MKITLTSREMSAIVRERYNLGSDIVVVIDDTNDIEQRVINGLAGLPEVPANKIARIKKLREIFVNPNYRENSGIAWSDMGLAEAKKAIENFPQFMNYIRTHNRLPSNTDY